MNGELRGGWREGLQGFGEWEVGHEYLKEDKYEIAKQ